MNFTNTTCLALLAAACAEFIVTAGETTKPKPGENPPPLGLETVLQAPRGSRPSWTALKGKVVVLEFWATWCGPCIAAIPHLNELADKFKDEPIQFIAITDQDEKVVRPFLQKRPMHAWVGLDTDKSVFEDYGITSIPCTVVVDKKGIIAAITHPTFLTEEHLKDLLAGRKLGLVQSGTEGRLSPRQVAVGSAPERQALFQVIIRPSQGGASSWASGKGSLTISGATVLNVLSSSYGINPTRIVTSSALPEGRFDFIVKTPETENENVKTWLRKAVESSFGVTARHETRETEVFILKAGEPTEHLIPTVSIGTASISSGGGSLNCANQSMSSLASSLEEILNKPVINETGLTNHYDFQLLWNASTSGEADPIELTRVLHEQLGLELAPAKRAVEFLAVTAENRQAGQSGDRVTK